MAALQEFAWFRERVVQIPGRFLIRHENFHATSPVPRSPPGIGPGNTAERRLRFAKPGEESGFNRLAGIIRPPDLSALLWHCLCN